MVKQMVDNKLHSDITIRTSDSHMVYAHKVFLFLVYPSMNNVSVITSSNAVLTDLIIVMCMCIMSAVSVVWKT